MASTVKLKTTKKPVASAGSPEALYLYGLSTPSRGTTEILSEAVDGTPGDSGSSY